jgi:hypothetical protein
MHNDGKMHKRWECLSRARSEGEERYCLFVTNTDSARCMYAWRNGSELALQRKGDWRADRNWALDFVDI